VKRRSHFVSKTMCTVLYILNDVAIYHVVTYNKNDPILPNSKDHSNKRIYADISGKWCCSILGSERRFLFLEGKHI
jgi:hypothetical protein